MLDVKQATKVFSAGTASEHHALNGLDLHLDDGEFVTIIGSNGAGKSTLFNAICGNYWLDQGQILLDGQDITFLSEHRRARVPGSDERNGAASDDRGKSGAGIYPEGSEAISKCGPQTGKGSISDRA